MKRKKVPKVETFGPFSHFEAKIGKKFKIDRKDRNKLQLSVSFGLSVLFWGPKGPKTERTEIPKDPKGNRKSQHCPRITQKLFVEIPKICKEIAFFPLFPIL